MFASGFRYKCRYGLELIIIAVSSRPRVQVPDVQRLRHRCRCSIDQRYFFESEHRDQIHAHQGGAPHERPGRDETEHFDCQVLEAIERLQSGE